MRALLPLGLWSCAVILSAGCNATGVRIDEDGMDSEDPEDTEDTEDWAFYDDATLRIVSPASGSFLPLGEVAHFEAVLFDAQGIPLDYTDIAWSSTADPTWLPVGPVFDDAHLQVGVHDLTAQVDLPNGDRLAHTVGGILVQSRYAGTYSGLFASDVTMSSYTVPCTGTMLLVVEPYGRYGTGAAACLASFSALDLQMSYLFELENQDGVVSGVVGADIGGWFTVDFPASGTLDPEGSGLTVQFHGDAVVAAVNGGAAAMRVSLDAGM